MFQLFRRACASLMPRYQTDDNFHDDPAVMRAGTAAVGLYYRCGVYVARHLLDGFVPSEIVAQYGTPEWVKRLVDAGLFETVTGGQQYFMPRYLGIDKNPTRAQVEADRAAKAKRQERWLLNKKLGADPDVRRVSRRVSRPSADAAQDASKDAALPTSLTGSKGAARASTANAARAAKKEKPPWCGSCNETTRLVEDSNGNPHRCEVCHPIASKEFR